MQDLGMGTFDTDSRDHRTYGVNYPHLSLSLYPRYQFDWIIFKYLLLKYIKSVFI